MTPLDQGYTATLQQYQNALLGPHFGAAGEQSAIGMLYQTFRAQAAILAYMDIFSLCAIMAFCAVPVAFFLSSRKGGAPGAAG
jgi:MFS transporter, DHA2 family, multidrug resistance protein